MTNKIFLGGVPYALDVKKLESRWPVPDLSEGLILTHEDLSGVLGIEPKTSRYYGVVNSWIARIKNQNGIFIAWEPSTGIKVLNPAEVLSFSETRTRQKIGQTGKAIKNYSWVDRERLDNTGQQRFDHQVRVANVVRQSLAAAKKDMAVELAPVKSLPKPKLIREAS